MPTAFRPSVAGTVTLAATTTTSRVAIATIAAPGEWRIYNAGAVAAFIVDGDVAVVATTATGLPIAPGAVEVLTLSGTHIAGITASGSATVYFTPGDGF
jgi:hypothetical protein